MFQNERSTTVEEVKEVPTTPQVVGKLRLSAPVQQWNHQMKRQLRKRFTPRAAPALAICETCERPFVGPTSHRCSCSVKQAKAVYVQ